MQPPPDIKETDPNAKPTFFRQYVKALRFYFITGLLVWVPLIVTLWVAWWLFKTVGLGLEKLIQHGYDALHALADRVPQLGFLHGFTYVRGFGFLVAVALFLTTGFLARSIVARRLISAVERVLDRVPLLNTIYRSVQQIRDVFIAREGAVFQKVVLVEFPRPGVWVIGFLTSKESGAVQQRIDGEFWGVFVPHVPLPTTGFLMFFHPDQVHILDVTVEEGMKIMISGGAYSPERFSAGAHKSPSKGAFQAG